jgi:type VI secretion system protein VasD
MSDIISHAKVPNRRIVLLNLGNAVIFASALFALSSCTSTGSSAPVDVPTPTARQLEVTIGASPTINPGPSGKASPLSLRIYVLRSPGKFQSVDYFTLKNNAASALGGDIIDSSDVSIRPGETKTISLNSGIDGAYIGVAAGFREIDSADWRAQTSIGDGTVFAVTAGKSSVSISRR